MSGAGIGRRLAAVLAVALAGTLGMGQGAPAQDIPPSQVDRGRYLARAANCQSCHTNVYIGGPAFAGGRPMETPFGVLKTANITFDVETGIGAYSRDEFARALREGVRRDGAHLYPAMPYTHYRRMPRSDVDAIYDYLRTVPPVRNEVVPEEEMFAPFRLRFGIAAWKMLHFEKGVVADEPERGRAWNLGRYLVEGPGHCAGCHTPKDVTGGDKAGENLRGGTLDNWHAPNIRGGENGGLAHWTEAEIVEFLRTGRNRHNASNVRMGEVVRLSTQYLNDEDLSAIATYLKSLDDAPRHPPSPVAADALRRGEGIFFDNCAACHRTDGQGVPGIFTPLAGSRPLQSDDPTTAIRTVLEGTQAVATDAHPSPFGMAAFHWKLGDDEIADVLNYVRNAWGNAAAPVDAGAVADLRETLRPDWAAIRHDPAVQQ